MLWRRDRNANLDLIAENGLRLTQFYTTGRCCPSRASLLTGQYPHRVGLGHMTKDIGRPGYRGRVSDDAKTIAERLGSAGYRSFLSGKWHLGTDDPTRHGFEKFYGTLVSAKTFWQRDHFTRIPDNESDEVDSQPFYATNAVADNALKFLDAAGQNPGQPWFLYVAFNAPHFPLHAPKRLIEKYADRFEDGWDVMRQRRLARMMELGIIPAGTRLPERSPHFDWAADEGEPTPAWETLPQDRRVDLTRRMAIYAAMVDSMDQNIGRIIREIKDRGELEDTLVVFTSDNGACAEWDPFGFDGKSGPNNVLHRGDAIRRMGGPGTFHSVGSGWAGASNTPWRMYKHYNHEGGIAVPCIIRPAGATEIAGKIDATPAHLIDVLATFLDVAGIDDGGSGRLPGYSLQSLVEGKELPPRQLFFEHEGNRAVRDAKWKLVALRDQPWELYDMRTDRTESNNVINQHPDVAERLSAAWDRWARLNQVTPLPDDYEVEYLPISKNIDDARD